MPATPLRSLIAMVLVALTLVSGGCSRRGSGPEAPAPLAATAPAGRLQELPPPGAVQQLAQRLGERQPRLEVLAPADHSLLGAGPWTLSLRLNDWPLADAGPLGLGPHVVVQVDDGPPQRLSQAEQLQAIPMAELSPGSHRITVYAARPWGEAVKSPGASRQLRLHRVAENPAQLPAPGSPQLIATSPSSLSSAEPVLVDWLLFDAPLQHLREGDGSWRLRVTVNGDSFLVDRQLPLWLKGLRNGSNAVQLELLDGRGDPLNPPFNSLVQEVVIRPGAKAAWQRPSLSAEELALLSGEPAPVAPAAAVVDRAEPEEPAAPEPGPHGELPAAGPAPDREQAPPRPAAPESAPPAEPAAPAAEASDAAELEAGPPAAPAPAKVQPPAKDEPAAPDPEPEPAAAVPEPAIPTAPPETAEPAAAPPAASAPPAAEGPAAADPKPAPVSPDRLRPSTSLSGSARDLVNADGSLVKPRPSGPLAGLREKLGG